MKLIVGLGNPGNHYQRSRHNAGFLVLEILINTNLCKSVSTWRLNKRLESEVALVTLGGGEKVVLAKPQTMMNASGRAVKKLLSFYKVAVGDLLVIHDDLDLKLGEFKRQLAKGPRVHHGVNSVEKTLGTKDFWRLRVGIDNRVAKSQKSKVKISGEEYVLQDFTAAEQGVLLALAEEKLRPQIITWLNRSS